MPTNRPPRLFPGADHTSQWYGDGNSDQGTITKCILHTTESAGGWPGYAGGGNAPNLTVNPITRKIRQHFPCWASARAVSDPTSTPVRENRDHVIQVEITGYCDPKYKASPYYVGAWTDDELGWLAEHVIAPIHGFGVPWTIPTLWLPYPSSYGATKARMSSSTYDSYTGFLGHQHVPGNDHGDPGILDVARIIALAKGAPLNQQEDDMPLTQADADLVAATVNSNRMPGPRDLVAKNPKLTWLITSMIESTQAYAVMTYREAVITRKLTERAAQQPGPLTAEQVKAATTEALAELVAGDIDVNVTVGGASS